jgi:hypothetical protein
MKLNLSLVSEGLGVLFEVVKSDVKRENLYLSQALLYAGESSFEAGMLYIGYGRDLPEKAFFEGACAVISIGRANKSYFASHNCDYLELEEDASLPAVHNTVQEVFRKYTEWRDSLISALVQEKSIDELMQLSLPVIGNPIYLHDKNFHMIAYAEFPDMPGGNDIYRVEDNEGRFSPEALNVLRETPNIEHTLTTTEACYHVDSGELSYIYDNIWHAGRYWGRLFVDERVRPFTKGDCAVVGELRRHIETALFRRNFFKAGHSHKLEIELTKMLDGSDVDLWLLEEKTKNLGWDRNDMYFCYRIKLSDRDIKLNTVINICETIESRMPDNIAFPYRDHLVGISCTKAGGPRAYTSMDCLKRLLAEYDLHAGISLLFYDFFELPRFYVQTTEALKYGMIEDPEELAHLFCDHSFSYMLDRCSEKMSADMLYPRGLFRLLDHDRDKSTSYVKTLRAYVECDCSPAKAMKQLYIQRSTFLYRLERINEIVDVDFSEPKTRLHYLIAFQLMDRNAS